MSGCNLCPRRCGARRDAGEIGLCGAGDSMVVARSMIHLWEEPCLGGRAGAIFFSGCSLGCVYCQNKEISRPHAGETGKRTLPGEAWDEDRLAREMLRLQAEGASCIDLVTPTHFAPAIRTAIRAVKPQLHVPIVWNTSGYETAAAIETLTGLVDIFLTDFKYGTREAAQKYSAAPDYPAAAAAALAAMYRAVGDFVFDGDRMVRGIILRHLVLPGGRRDSAAALHLAAESVPPRAVVLSLMRQYTPDFAPREMRELTRRVTSFEYDFVAQEALSLGYTGYGQDRESASAAYTPDF